MLNQSFDVRECWRFIGLFKYNEDIHYKLNLKIYIIFPNNRNVLMSIIKRITTSLFGLTRAVSVSVAQATSTLVRDRRVRKFGNGFVLVTFVL